MANQYAFKTPEGAEQFLTAYNATLAKWPVTPEALDVPTRFGTTHINAVGDANAPPLVLLHGFGVSSTQWYANIEPLSRAFRVYAPDMINQTGLSVAARPLKTGQDCADWLSDVLDALKIDRVTLIGHSYGGWLALNLALIAPQRVERMVLLSPAACFTQISLPFMAQFLFSVFFPSRKSIYRFLQTNTTMKLADGQPEVEQLLMGIKHLKPEQFGAPVTRVFSDAELGTITMPTLLLIGDHDVSCKPQRVMDRACRVMPQIEAELIAGGGHLFPTDQAEATNSRMMRFLNQSL